VASKNKIRVGDIWADMKGRQYEVTGGLDTRGKIPLHNHATNRPINSKGPRALVRLVSQGQGPKITRAAANPAPAPFPGMPATRAPKAGPLRPANGLRPVPPQFAARGLQRPVRGPRRAAAPSASTPPLHFGPETAAMNRPNPATYPSALAQAVAVAMHNLPPHEANDPTAVRSAAYLAIADHVSQPRGRNPMVPPVVMGHGEAGYPGQYGGAPQLPREFSSPRDFGREAYREAPAPFAPPAQGHPGQYGRFVEGPMANPGYGYPGEDYYDQGGSY
jgi:hypothetical protein